MAYFRSDNDIIGFFWLGGMKMSWSAGLFNKKNKIFTSSGTQRWAERRWETQKKYGHPLYIITVMRESYVEGTTFSGGLPPYIFVVVYVSNRLVDVMIV